MDTLNQTLIRGIPLLQRVLGGRSHFSASLTLTVFVKNVSLMSSYLDPYLDGGGFMTWIMRQGEAEASTRLELGASLLEQYVVERLASPDSL